MAGVGGEVDGGRELSEVEQQNPLLGRLIRRLIDGVNTLATNTATSATGENAPPKPPDSVQVATFGEYIHISIQHSGPLQRGVRYFSEIGVDDPKFNQPIVVDHGSSRTSHPFPLPTNVSEGTKHSYYVRSYAQYLSSQPSAPTVAGGLGGPTAFTLTGATVGTPLASAGSGTGSNSGQQGGSGLGKVQRRGA